MAKTAVSAYLIASLTLASCSQPMIAPTLARDSQPTSTEQATEESATSTALVNTPMSTVQLSPTAQPTQVAVQVPFQPPTGVIAFQAIQEQDGIFVAKADGSGARQIISGEDIFSGPIAWAPDGQTLFFLSDRGSAHGMLEIYQSDAEGLHLRRLTHDEYFDWDVVLSPDGKEIAYVSTRPTATGAFARQLFVMPVNGGAAERLTEENVDVWNAAWSPSGMAIALTTTPHGDTECPSLIILRLPGDLTDISGDKCHFGAPQWRPNAFSVLTICQGLNASEVHGVCVSDSGSGGQSLVVEGDVDAAAWDPDGATIAFAMQIDESTRSVRTIEPGGRNEQIIVAAYPVTFAGSDVAWSPDGSYIAYTAQVEQGDEGVYLVGAEGGEPIRLPMDIRGPIGVLSWHP